MSIRFSVAGANPIEEAACLSEYSRQRCRCRRVEERLQLNFSTGNWAEFIDDAVRRRRSEDVYVTVDGESVQIVKTKKPADLIWNGGR